MNTTLPAFRVDAMGAFHVPLLLELMNDRAALRAAGEALAAMERLIHGMTPRTVLAHLVTVCGGDRAEAVTALHELAACAGTAAAALRPDAAHVTALLRQDGAMRRELDSAASARLRVAQNGERGAAEELACVAATGRAEEERLRAAGLRPSELEPLLQARAAGAGQRRAELNALLAGWQAEAAVLAEYLDDPMRSRARLGPLASLLEAERVPADDAGRLAVEVRWRAAGPLALAIAQG